MAAEASSERGERTVKVRDVRPVQSRSGNTRYVLTDDQGHRYTTFHEEIGNRALSFIGKPAKIGFHRTQRGNFENVYLDAIDDTPDEITEMGGGEAGRSTARPFPEDVEEIAWKTAVDAAPWLVGAEPKSALSPEELFERLKPFKDLVADDLLKTRAANETAEEERDQAEGGGEQEDEERPSLRPKRLSRRPPSSP